MPDRAPSERTDRHGDAYDTIERFWALQDSGDYTTLIDLFAADAELVDPIYGTFSGREAIGDFMTRMTAELGPRGISFRLVELAGDDHTAWAQWELVAPEGTRSGVGVYRVRDGHLTYYRDYLNG